MDWVHVCCGACTAQTIPVMSREIAREDTAEGTWDQCWSIWRSNNLSKGLILWKE